MSVSITFSAGEGDVGHEQQQSVATLHELANALEAARQASDKFWTDVITKEKAAAGPVEEAPAVKRKAPADGDDQGDDDAADGDDDNGAD